MNVLFPLCSSPDMSNVGSSLWVLRGSPVPRELSSLRWWVGHGFDLQISTPPKSPPPSGRSTSQGARQKTAAQKGPPKQAKGLRRGAVLDKRAKAKYVRQNPGTYCRKDPCLFAFAPKKGPWLSGNNLQDRSQHPLTRTSW